MLQKSGFNRSYILVFFKVHTRLQDPAFSYCGWSYLKILHGHHIGIIRD